MTLALGVGATTAIFSIVKGVLRGEAPTGRTIIDRIAQQSAAFGTTIVYENAVGVWRVGAKTSSAPEDIDPVRH